MSGGALAIKRYHESRIKSLKEMIDSRKKSPTSDRVDTDIIEKVEIIIKDILEVSGLTGVQKRTVLSNLMDNKLNKLAEQKLEPKGKMFTS